MNQGRLVGLLLGPSLLSTTTAVVLTFIVLAVTTWSYASPDNPLYEYFFGTYGLTTIFQNAPNALAAINGVFDSPRAYNIAVIVFALLVGLVVYVFLQGIDYIADKTKEEVDDVTVNYISDATIKKTMRKEAELRLGLRLAALLLWIVYCIFFARIIVPYCILLAKVSTTDLWTWSMVWHGLIALLVLIAAFHVHAVLMRLLVLRPRLFGSNDIVARDGGH